MSSTIDRHDDGVFVLNLGDGDVRFNADTVDALNAHLDEIESAVGQQGSPAALVTISESKIWHNGLDLDWMGGIDDVWAFVDTVKALFARFMRLPVPTVAAIGGHAFAGGAMFALAHDQRVMRSNRGFFCLPEVDLGMSFGAGFAALVSAKVPTVAVSRLAVLGERFTGPEAADLGVVDLAVAEDEVVVTATKLAHRLAAKAGPAIPKIRTEYFGHAIETLAAERRAS